ncbi:MAG: DUF1501 domain-containing protein [Sphingobacteriales bacterium]|nr:MAG: DUF1501 domain-containing protein [Sphingobacteriales bacterium]
MKRRKFLSLTSTGIAGLQFTPVFGQPEPEFSKGKIENDHILIFIQLNGGNDGLNTVIPLGSYRQLKQARPNILISEDRLLCLTDTLSLHPNLNGLQTLFEEQQLCIVQNVGYPNQNRSHFRSLDIWNSGSPSDKFWDTGWLARYLEKKHSGFPVYYPNPDFPAPLAISLGNMVSETCQGLNANFGFTLSSLSNLSNLSEPTFAETLHPAYSEELAFLRTGIVQTNAYVKVVEKAVKLGRNKAIYPENNELAQQLKIAARLISGGLPTKVYVLTLAGFDTHAHQVQKGETDSGTHAVLLKTLSDAIFAFQKDLGLLGLDHRVLGMTYSEFGRQIRSNEALGTDHGAAAPLFVFGTNLQHQIIGNNPVIQNEIAPQEGVSMQYDFREVYASVLVNWLGVSAGDIPRIFNQSFNTLPIVKKV